MAKKREVGSLKRDDLLRGASRYLLVVVGFIVVNALINLFEPYRTVDARITKAEQLCDYYRPRNKTGWPEERDHKPVPPGAIPYDAAKERELDRESAFPVKRYYVLFSDYESPADGKPHSQRVQVRAERLPLDVNPGMTIKLSVLKTEPYSVRFE
jgi:hypothetical protein